MSSLLRIESQSRQVQKRKNIPRIFLAPRKLLNVLAILSFSHGGLDVCTTFLPLELCHHLHDRSEMVHGVSATGIIGSIIHKGINDFLIASTRARWSTLAARASTAGDGTGGKELLSGRFIVQLAPFIRPRGGT